MAFRPAFRSVLAAEEDQTLDWADFWVFLLAATVMASVWPVYLLVRGAKRISKGRDPQAAARIIGGESRQNKLRRLQRAEYEREAYIAQLESEVGIERQEVATPL